MVNYSLTRTVLTVLAALSITACTQSPVGPSPNADSGPNGTLSLRGHVMNSVTLDRTNVSGIDVALSNGTATRRALTDGNGDFAIEGIAAGEWTLTLSYEGSVYLAESVSIESDVDLTWALDRGIPVPSRVPNARRIK